MIEEEHLSVAASYITRAKPFGPTNAEKLADPEIAKYFFDRNNRIWNEFQKNPIVIVGRRGSGKTAYLHSILYANSRDLRFEVDTEDIFTRTLATMDQMLAGTEFPEHTSDVWETVFYLLIFANIIKIEKELGHTFPITRKYLEKLGVDINSMRSTDELLWQIVDTVAKRLGNKPAGLIAELIKYFPDVTFNDAKLEVAEYLTSSNRKAILLLDSLDGYPLHRQSVENAIIGFLKCVGHFGQVGSPFELRCCVPAELYFYFLRTSSNPLKDFDSLLFLHWHSRELLAMAAKRIMLYAQVHEPLLFEHIRYKDADNKRAAKEIFYSVFPRSITNGMGFREETLTYILRHTQLLPRQLLLHLNTIGSRALTHSGKLEISEDDIVGGIAQAEHRIAQEIFSAYKGVHNLAEDISRRIVPELLLAFDFGTLHKAYNSFARKLMGEKDFFYFRQMLLEVGVIGQVENHKTPYIHGLFEYNVPNKLAPHSTNELCMHPIFAGALSCKGIAKKDHRETVFPYGSDPDGEDKRDFAG